MLSFEDDVPLGLHAVSPSFMPTGGDRHFAAVGQTVASDQIISASEGPRQGVGIKTLNLGVEDHLSVDE